MITQMKQNSSCVHLGQVKHNTQPKTDGCEECLQTGYSWVHLRLCLSCRHVGGCYSSINKHGIKHFKATRYPIITSFEPGENWMVLY
jgi:hypothetical protein